MSAAPKGKEQSRYSIISSTEPDNPCLEMPDIYRGAHLIGYLQEMGFFSNTGFGPSPLNFSELRAWQESTCLALNPWEVLALRRLSVVYVDQLRISTDPQSRSPYMVDDIEQRRATVTAFFKNLAKRDSNANRHRTFKRKGNR